jgi:hypothetical protein
MSTKLNFDEFLHDCLHELQAKTQVQMNTWGIHKPGRWDIDSSTGLLTFRFKDGVRADCKIQIIGTFSTITNTWLWSWGNASIPTPMHRDSLRVKRYGEQRHHKQLTQAKWPANEQSAWLMTALAVKLCQAKGAYRCPGGDVISFVSIHSVRLSKVAE